MKTHRLLLITLALLLASGAAAQQVTCPPANQPLVKIPELVSSGGTLRGTVIVGSDKVSIPFRVPPSAPLPNSGTQCFVQTVRVVRGVNTSPATPVTEPGSYALPLPGPTLRARVGDLVQLTFLNQIDAGSFPYSIDAGEAADGGGCDAVKGLYPKNTSGFPPVNDQFPNCFHGSSTSNLHFHGSHVNPNSTGDNVFIQLRPSPRTNETNEPTVTQESVRASFDEFFQRCAMELKPERPLRMWPFTWDDLPKSYTQEQKRLLQEYDKTIRKTPVKKLWPIDEASLRKGDWPMYYIGAYPYCFRIPEYSEKTTEAAADAQQTHTHGAGEAEVDAKQDPQRPLIMGQAPGTHWYHAHKHGSTAINVANGMTGAFVIEGKYDDELNAFYGENWTRSQPVMVINQLGVTPNLERGGQGQDKGPDFSVNGRLQPVITMRPGEVQMWRIVNTSGRAGIFFVGPPQNFNWKQIAQDGVQFADVNYQASNNDSFLLASGNRADLLVQAPTSPAGALIPVLVQNEVDPSDLATAAQITLFYVNVTGDAATGNQAKFIPNAPTFPAFLADITDAEVQGTKKITFSSTSPGKGGVHKIDDKQFSGEVGEVVLLNTVEEWKVMNATYGPAISHPFHIHVNPFQVIEVFSPNDTITDPRTGQSVPRYVFDKAALTVDGQCYLDPHGNPDSWKPCGPPAPTPANAIWWDVFPIPSGIKATDAQGKPILDDKGQQIGIPGYFRMRSRFVDYSGFYVMHCHILAHEDRGMMTIVEVAPLQSPYSHH